MHTNYIGTYAFMFSGALLSFSVFNGSNHWTKMINYISSFLAIIYFLIFIIINTTLPNDEKD